MQYQHSVLHTRQDEIFGVKTNYIIVSGQVLKKRTKEVRQEEQRNKKKNRHKEKKEDKAADEVLSGEVEWEVYFNKVQTLTRCETEERL